MCLKISKKKLKFNCLLISKEVQTVLVNRLSLKLKVLTPVNCYWTDIIAHHSETVIWEVYRVKEEEGHIYFDFVVYI